MHPVTPRLDSRHANIRETGEQPMTDKGSQGVEDRTTMADHHAEGRCEHGEAGVRLLPFGNVAIENLVRPVESDRYTGFIDARPDRIKVSRGRRSTAATPLRNGAWNEAEHLRS